MGDSQKKGDSYEQFIAMLIQRVNEYGHDIRNISSGKKNRIQGISGCKHQIDISFYDYSLPQKTLVLIECKNNPSKTVEKVHVAALKAIIDDIHANPDYPNSVIGVFAYSERARSGALKFGNYYNIQMEKTGISPNFAFKYGKLIQVAVTVAGASNASGNLTVMKST